MSWMLHSINLRICKHFQICSYVICTMHFLTIFMPMWTYKMCARTTLYLQICMFTNESIHRPNLHKHFTSGCQAVMCHFSDMTQNYCMCLFTFKTVVIRLSTWNHWIQTLWPLFSPHIKLLLSTDQRKEDERREGSFKSTAADHWANSHFSHILWYLELTENKLST